jgi:hypothetical protein
MILSILKIAYQYHYFVLIFLSGGMFECFPSAPLHDKWKAPVMMAPPVAAN